VWTIGDDGRKGGCREHRLSRIVLAGDAEFDPIFSRHYVMSKCEIRDFARLLGVKPSWAFAAKVHLLTTFAIEGVLKGDGYVGPVISTKMRDFLKRVAKGGEAAAAALSENSSYRPIRIAFVSLVEAEHGPPPTNGSLEDMLSYVNKAQQLAKDILGKIAGPGRGDKPDHVLRNFLGGVHDMGVVFGADMALPRHEQDAGRKGSYPFFEFSNALLLRMALTGVAVVDARGVLPVGHPLSLDERAAAKARGQFQLYKSLCEPEAQRQLTRRIEAAKKATAA